MIVVKIYSGQVEIERKSFKTMQQAMKYASYWQDNGFKVRMVC